MRTGAIIVAPVLKFLFIKHLMIFFKPTYHPLLTASLCLMASCASDVPETPVPEDEVRFETFVTSRSTLTTNDNLRNNSFAVFGDLKSETAAASDAPLCIFNNCEVKYTDGYWKYAHAQYWFPNHEHSFVALHPANASCVSHIQYSNNQLNFTYTSPLDDYKKASDLLVAAHRRNYVEGQAKAAPVRFRFDHILSNVNIRVSYYNPNKGARPLSVNSIAFKNIPVAATYSIAPAKLAGNFSTYDYANNLSLFEGLTITGKDNLNIEFNGADARNILPDGKPYDLFSGHDALLLLPNPDASIEMAVSYTTYPGGIQHDESETLTIPVSLLPGYSYTLLLSLRDDKLKFSFEVAEWEVGIIYNTTVPRK